MLVLPTAPPAYDASNERQTRNELERQISDLQANLQLIRVSQGSLALGETTVTLANGANNNVATGYTTYVRVSGPTGAFSITGLEGGETGRVRVITNTTSQVMTIAHQSASSSAMNRIITDAAADVTVGLNGFAVFVYDATQTRWVLWDRTGGVADGDKGDITVSGAGTIWTIDNNAATDAKLRDSVALSVIGRSANSTGDPADIAAASDHQVLRRSGTTIAFGAVNLAQAAAVTGDLPFANLAQGSALSVLGVAGNATADVASIAAANDGEVLRRSGASVGFGTVATAGIANDAVTYDKIQNVSATDRLLGRATAGAGDPEEIVCTAQARALLDDATAADQRSTMGVASSIRRFYTSSTTWNKPANLVKIRVRALGGGGATPAVTGGAGQMELSSGGSSGTYAECEIVAASLASSETVTVGAGGTAGGNGGDTSFGAHLVCPGGPAGNVLAAGAVASSSPGTLAAAASGTATIVKTITGAQGQRGIRYDAATGFGGVGGSNPDGVGGIAGSPGSVGTVGNGYGSGAGGPCSQNTTTRNGGAGRLGYVEIEEFYI